MNEDNNTPSPETHLVGSGKLHNWSEKGVCQDCGCHSRERVDPCADAWRYRHVPYVEWSFSSTRHPKEDLEQEALYTADHLNIRVAELEAEILRLKSERPYIIGCNDGFEEGITQAAAVAYSVCAETRHVTLGDKAAAAIRSLAVSEGGK